MSAPESDTVRRLIPRTVPPTPLPAPRSAPPARRLLDRFFVHGTVVETQDIAARTRRVRVTGEALRGLDWTPGQHVRLQVADLAAPRTWLGGLRDALRTYSVWDYDERGWLDLCVLDHPGGGPGARWSREVRVGQRVDFGRPEGRLVVRADAPYHVFVGDETASVAFGAILRALPPKAKVFGVIEVGSPHDRLPIPRSNELQWTYRGTGGLALADALCGLDLPDEPGMAYVAGEARAAQAARRHLTAGRGWPRSAVTVKPFWAPGKRGMD